MRNLSIKNSSSAHIYFIKGGVGGGVGTWSYDYNNNNDNGAYALVAGDLGIEYNFDIPIQLSLDFRPELYFNSDDFREDNFGPDIALGIRFRF